MDARTAGFEVRAVLVLRQGLYYFNTGGDLEEAKAMMREPAVLDAFLQFDKRHAAAARAACAVKVAACQGLSLAGGLELA